MKRVTVGKTIVAYPGKTEFVRVFDDGDPADGAAVVKHPQLDGLAASIRATESAHDDIVAIKSDVPDLLWVGADEVIECARLTRDELRELAKLLRKTPV